MNNVLEDSMICIIGFIITTIISYNMILSFGVGVSVFGIVVSIISYIDSMYYGSEKIKESKK